MQNNSPVPEIVVTGASGFIGQHFVPALKADGYNILLCGRDVEKLELQFPEFECCDLDTLLRRAPGARVLVHLEVRNNNQSGDDDAFMAANLERLQSIVEIAKYAGIKGVIYPASLQANAHGKTPYARSKFAAEQYLLAKPQQELNVTLLRLAAVYESVFKGRLSFLNRLPRFLRNPILTILGSIKPIVHMDRVIAAMLQAVKTPENGERILTDSQEKNLAYGFGRRTIDLVFCFSILVFFWWLLVGVWCSIKLTSPGPGFFTQERVGRDRKVFICYKFRTMHTGTKQAGTHEISETSVTKFGAFLRRSKIDELPQIWNILRGDLSLVGPRPCLPTQTALIHAREEQGVFAINPGITGLAQVQKINMSEPKRLAAIDGSYVNLRSLSLDVRIIIMTLIGKGFGDHVSNHAHSK